MKLVLIDWIDTFANVGWSDAPIKPCKVASVGWVVEENSTAIVISAMVCQDETGFSYNCQQAIPRGCITKIQELRKKKDVTS